MFTSDGLRQYFYAFTAHFGQRVEGEGKRKPVWQALPSLLYGQFRRLKMGRKLRRVYAKRLCGRAANWKRPSRAWGIQTAFIERLNLTLRHLVAVLSRRGWALAQNREGLRWRMAIAAGYYNFCRTHHGSRVPMGEGRFRGRTPLMALGVTNHCWSDHEFITHPVYQGAVAQPGWDVFDSQRGEKYAHDSCK